MKQRIAWWLRNIADPGWTRWHVHRCLKCGRRFADTEPGAWTDIRADEFPELCNCRDRRGHRTNSHTNCRACGPYCPQCAAATEQELLATREAYGD